MIHLQTLLVSVPLGFAISAIARHYQPDTSSHQNAAALQRYRDSALSRQHYYHDEGDAPPNPPKEHLDLLDTVLLASVDGKFHAVNRTTAETIWSMDDPRVLPTALRDKLYPLVRTQHPRIHADSDSPFSLEELEEDVPETFIIEPQSGTIFVNSPAAYRDDPLQRLPFSVPKLAEMSPFKYDDLHTFVAKKSSAFISLDLRTGQILDILDPDKCEWNEAPHRQNNPHLGVSEEDMLDELEQESAPKLQKLEVHIGRTDYHVSVYSRGRVIQNLTFTEYGPNKADKTKQDLWRRTPDNTYFQPLPDGRLLLLTTEADQPVRGFVDVHFRSPIVAIFDVLMDAETQSPLALLQPSPGLRDLYSPTTDDPTRQARLAELVNQELTYVGRVGNSLYAMSYLHFPLVSFSDAFPKRRTIDSSTSSDNDAENVELNEADYGTICRTLDCLTGIHYSKHAGRTWMSRLITDGIPPEHDAQPQSVTASAQPVSSSTTVLMLPPPSSKSTSIISPSSTDFSIEPPTVLTSPPVTLLPPSHGPSSGIWDLIAGGRALLATLASMLMVVLLIFFKKLRYTRWDETNTAPLGRDHNLFSSLTYAQSPDAKFVPMVEKDLPPIPDEVPTEPVTILSLPPASLSAPQLPTNTSTLPKPNGVLPASLPTPPPSNGHPPIPLDQPTATPPAQDNEDAGIDGDSGVEEAGAGNGGAFKKRRRRTRGKGGKKAVVIDPAAKSDEPVENGYSAPPNANKAADSGGGSSGSGSNIIIAPPKAEQPAFASSLIVSDTVLGYGSHGTVVYRGSFQGREVAVKRLLNDFVTLAIREVTLLQESDDHPNVIRYYFKESKDNFLYIALELCPASLADLVERAGAAELRELVSVFEPRRALAQVTAGLRHLHGMKIVHRDIKPQNILVSRPTTSSARGSTASLRSASKTAAYRMLISDFGLCRKLDSDQTSFLPTHVGAAGAGTVGWRAPEILRGEVKLDEQTGDASTGGGGTPNSSIGGTGRAGGNSTHRLTKAVDIFALGCLFYYTLTGGEHPYGNRYERESNILRNQMNLSWLEKLGEDGLVAQDLIAKMLDMDPKKRPDTTEILLHPFFWTPARRLAFLQDASDRFEIMERDPREPPLVALEAQAPAVVGPDWFKLLDRVFIENLGKFRKYDGKSVQDLLRAFRNKKHHYQDLPDNVKRNLGPLPHGFLAYFTKRFPRLFLHVYYVIALDPLIRTEPMFRSYFELADSD